MQTDIISSLTGSEGDKQRNRNAGWINEAIWTRQMTPIMNRDEGGYLNCFVYKKIVICIYQLAECFNELAILHT